ncbi:hypothetical protein BC938DRAFT_481717 [Jimgerdemannia flammicorona]|uniref:Metallo-beta-lactamase domain-containing protein n=1 Tax=Jimgerdemannia flammicorona TaxID=994334 RepID=A0A433QFH6_9FUNG|nr:hypothetical protein BC938DRAFT_481717 [Jimgerdemannia flammicorona]
MYNKDEQVVRELNNTVTWYIPMGLRDWFVRRGVYNVIELDWWQEIHHKERQDIVIAAVPCMVSFIVVSCLQLNILYVLVRLQWSYNLLFVVSPAHTALERPLRSLRHQPLALVLLCRQVATAQLLALSLLGDTGYSQDLFKAIGEKYLPITVAALPVGGYEPQWYMRHMHMSPDDALAAHFALSQPRLTIGVRWGTFMLSNELYLDPPRRLVAAAEKLGVANEVQCIGLGKTVEIPEGEELEEDLDEEEMRARGAQGRRDTYEIERIVIELNAEGEALGWSTTESA